MIETLVAITLLTVAIVAPMALTVQSLKTAYYARDQVTAFYLAQEAIEGVRALRDSQILQISKSSTPGSIDLFGTIPLNSPFRIDTRVIDPAFAIVECGGPCPPLKTNGTLYGYDSSWTTNSIFTRTVVACYIQSNGNCTSIPVTDEMRVSVTVSWKTGSIQSRSFSISENMYRWINDGSAAP